MHQVVGAICDSHGCSKFHVVAKKVLCLCDGLSAIDDIGNGVLSSLVPDFVSMLRLLIDPISQHEASMHVTV